VFVVQAGITGKFADDDITISLYSVVDNFDDGRVRVTQYATSPVNFSSVFKLPTVSHDKLRDSLCEFRNCRNSLQWVDTLGLTDVNLCRHIGAKMLAIGAHPRSSLCVNFNVDASEVGADRTVSCLRDLLTHGIVECVSDIDDVSAWRLSNRGFNSFRICIDLASGRQIDILKADANAPLKALTPYALMDKLQFELGWTVEVVRRQALQDVRPYGVGSPKVLYKDKSRLTLSTYYLLALADSDNIFKTNPSLAICHDQAPAYYKFVFEKHAEPSIRLATRLAIGYQEDDAGIPEMPVLKDKRARPPGRQRGGLDKRARHGFGSGDGDDFDEDEEEEFEKDGDPPDSPAPAPVPVPMDDYPDGLDVADSPVPVPMDDDDLVDKLDLPGDVTPPAPVHTPTVTPPGSPPPLPHPVAKRYGEWENYFGNRLTKKKKNCIWVGWQIICSRHSDPERFTSKFKCSREATFALKDLDVASTEFADQNHLLRNQLMHWAVTGEGYDRQTHMFGWVSGGAEYPIATLELETLAFFNQEDVEALHAVAVAASSADEVLCPGEVVVDDGGSDSAAAASAAVPPAASPAAFGDDGGASSTSSSSSSTTDSSDSD
jgi:hypothetical protein